MTDQKDSNVGLISPMGDFPSLNIPTTYSDGISGVSPGPNVVKIYFSRVDSSIQGTGDYKNNTILQIVMPLPNLIQSAQFLTNMVDNLVSTNQISIVDVQKYRALAGKPNDSK